LSLRSGRSVAFDHPLLEPHAPAAAAQSTGPGLVAAGLPVQPHYLSVTRVAAVAPFAFTWWVHNPARVPAKILFRGGHQAVSYTRSGCTASMPAITYSRTPLDSAEAPPPAGLADPLERVELDVSIHHVRRTQPATPIASERRRPSTAFERRC